VTAAGAERAGVILEAAGSNRPIRYPSVPLADDPELAEHALWNEEIADDLEEMDLAWEDFREVHDLPDIAGYRTPVERANEARTELARLAALTEAAAFAYRGAIRELHESGLSYARIGAALGISRGTVQKHMEWERRNGG
jgi:DNA-directed RNA polymerase specialized sigma24 family protein